MDREKVIKGLEICKPSKYSRTCGICPYREEMNCDYEVYNDAIALLEKQEAVEPKKGWFLNDLNIPEEHWYCGKCDEELVGKGKYCTNCGQAVKWD